jgi:hypothetical protein
VSVAVVLGALRECGTFGVIGGLALRPGAGAMIALDVIEALNVVDDALEMSGNERIAIVGEVDVIAVLVLVDGDAEGLLDDAGGGLDVDQEPVIEAVGDCQALAVGPVDDSLLILGGGSEAGVPLSGREELVKQGRAAVGELAKKFFFLSQMRGLEGKCQAEFPSGIVVSEAYGRPVQEPLRRMTFECDGVAELGGSDGGERDSEGADDQLQCHGEAGAASESNQVAKPG